MTPLAYALAFVLTPMGRFQEVEAEELLGKMRQAYRETKTASFQTKSSINEKSEKIVVTLNGEFANPNRMRVSFTGIPSGEATLICDGKEVAIVIEGQPKRSLEYSVDNLGKSLFANLETLCFFDWKRQLSTAEGGNMKTSKLKVVKEDWNGKNWLVLEEHAEMQRVDVRYFIDPETYFIWRTVSTLMGEKEPFMDAQVLRLELNKVLDDKLFVIPKNF